MRSPARRWLWRKFMWLALATPAGDAHVAKSVQTWPAWVAHAWNARLNDPLRTPKDLTERVLRRGLAPATRRAIRERARAFEPFWTEAGTVRSS